MRPGVEVAHTGAACAQLWVLREEAQGSLVVEDPGGAGRRKPG